MLRSVSIDKRKLCRPFHLRTAKHGAIHHTQISCRMIGYILEYGAFSHTIPPSIRLQAFYAGFPLALHGISLYNKDH